MIERVDRMAKGLVGRKRGLAWYEISIIYDALLYAYLFSPLVLGACFSSLVRRMKRVSACLL